MKKTINLCKKIFSFSFFYPFIISPLLILLYKIYLKKISAFGCFDDCFNIVAGYFISQEKILYKEIFFNHQPLMAYISFAIQSFSDPINIFALILAHRKFILIFSILLNLLISFRFKFAGVLFVLFYEATKFYVFGDRFLAEAIIVYPLVYMIGLVWYKFNNKNLYKIEYILAAVFTWFIIFLREPFIPVSIILFLLILWPYGYKTAKIKLISISIFTILTLYFLFKLPLQDYIFNVITINRNVVLSHNLISFNLIAEVSKIFFYPVYVLFAGDSGFFRTILISLSILFVVSTGFLLLRIKKVKIIGLVIFILGLANIRYVTPGHAFYESFHMAPWYGMFIFTTFIFLKLLWEKFMIERIKYFFIMLISLLFLYTLSPQSFLWEKIDQHAEFINNYGNYLSSGEAARILGSGNGTFFVDGFDELIHWQSRLQSSYKYSWYTSVMPKIPLYSKSRLEMFKTNPPDIYYGSCPKETADFRLIPKKYNSLYLNLVDINNKPTCLYIKKSNIKKISKNQWLKLNEFGFYLP